MSDEGKFQRPKWDSPEINDYFENLDFGEDERQVGCYPHGAPCHPNCRPWFCHPRHCYPAGQVRYPLEVLP